MKAKFVLLPGGIKTVEQPGTQITVEDALRLIGETWEPNGTKTLAIGPTKVTDPQAVIPDGATVTLTDRVAGG